MPMFIARKLLLSVFHKPGVHRYLLHGSTFIRYIIVIILQRKMKYGYNKKKVIFIKIVITILTLIHHCENYYENI